VQTSANADHSHNALLDKCDWRHLMITHDNQHAPTCSLMLYFAMLKKEQNLGSGSRKSSGLNRLFSVSGCTSYSNFIKIYNSSDKPADQPTNQQIENYKTTSLVKEQ